MKIRWSWILGWVINIAILEVVFVGLVEDTGLMATIIAIAVVVLMLSLFALGLYLIGRDSKWKEEFFESDN